MQHILLLPFSFRRIILVTTCIALFVFIGAIVDRHGRQVVAGINITNGLFAQASIDLPPVEGAVSYNIYYKKEQESNYNNTVREVPAYITTYTVSYLTKGATYKYKVAAVDASGGEFWWSDEKTLTSLSPM